MRLIRRLALIAFVLATSQPLAAQQRDDAPVPSTCLAVAESLPNVVYASYAQLSQAEEVVITYAGHSTFIIESPQGVRIATDFNGYYGANPLPDVITMNKARRTHFTEFPDPGIEHVLHGWNPDGGAARHAVVVDDVYIRNVPTDIRRWDQLEVGGNSIFIFEIAGLCIGHLGHLHHHLEDAHYAAIGRLDVLMVPIDGGMTLSVEAMSDIAKRLFSSLILPMHRHATPIGEFTRQMGETFDLRFSESASVTVSVRNLPRRPTILVMKGV
jgi:L-ascorbate metabolism protein UlaG (beta-lactamase superfamily)